LGTDGIILKKDGHLALFCPGCCGAELDSRRDPDALILKAGLPQDGWKKDAAFEVFQAEVFGEEK